MGIMLHRNSTFGNPSFIRKVGLACVILLMVVIAEAAILRSHAATSSVSAEPETGSITLGAQKLADATASGGYSIRFGATNLSGLPWLSGVNSGLQGSWATFRGRPVDLVTTWEDDGSWRGTENVWALSTGSLNGYGGKLSVAIPMLSNTNDNFTACARGDYDTHFTALGNTLKQYGRADSFVRLGWEGNGTWYAWSVGSNPSAWVTCFQHEVTALRAADPAVIIDWNMNKDASIDARTMYPGDAYVGVIGVDFYDMYPHYNSDADWNYYYNTTRNGGPLGLGSWLAFAKLHGKKLSVPEWGVNNGGGDGGTDNPLFIQKMNDFFKANAADIAYESYFNSQCPNFCLDPPGKNPLASSKYSQLW